MAESWREKAGSSFCRILFAPATRAEGPLFCSRAGFSASGLKEGGFFSGGRGIACRTGSGCVCDWTPVLNTAMIAYKAKV